MSPVLRPVEIPRHPGLGAGRGVYTRGHSQDTIEPVDDPERRNVNIFVTLSLPR